MRLAYLNVLYTIGLLAGMLILLEVGRRIGQWRIRLMEMEPGRASELSRALY